MIKYLLASILLNLMVLYVLTYTVYAIKHEATIKYDNGTFECRRVE